MDKTYNEQLKGAIRDWFFEEAMGLLRELNDSNSTIMLPRIALFNEFKKKYEMDLRGVLDR